MNIFNICYNETFYSLENYNSELWASQPGWVCLCCKLKKYYWIQQWACACGLQLRLRLKLLWRSGGLLQSSFCELSEKRTGGWQVGAGSAVLWMLYWSVVVKMKQSWKAKLHKSGSVLTLSCGHGLGILTKEDQNKRLQRIHSSGYLGSVLDMRLSAQTSERHSGLSCGYSSLREADWGASGIWLGWLQELSLGSWSRGTAFVL